MNTEKTKVAIIGSGPAGYTAAIYAARANLNPILFQGPQPGGQLTITNDVENFPGYPDGIQGPEMMVQFQAQAERFGTKVINSTITAVDFSGPVHKLTIDDKTILEAETVIISTGASAKWLGLPSEQEYNGKGVSACAVCDGFFYKNQIVAVVGGGDTACEEAHYLSHLAKKVYLLVRKGTLRASQIMQKRILARENVEVLWNTETLEILGDESGVNAVKTKNAISGEVKDIAVTGFFVAIGHKPNTDIFQGILNLDENGYIQTEKGSTRTNISGVFACGDAQDHIYRQAVTAAGTGCMAALDAERYLASVE